MNLIETVTGAAQAAQKAAEELRYLAAKMNMGRAPHPPEEPLTRERVAALEEALRYVGKVTTVWELPIPLLLVLVEAAKKGVER